MLVLAMQFSRNSHGGLRPPWTPEGTARRASPHTWASPARARGRRARRPGAPRPIGDRGQKLARPPCGGRAELPQNRREELVCE